MLKAENIRTILFTILCICVIYYLFIGIDSYNRDNKSKGNIVFFILCIASSIWALGYTFMLISPNIEVANIWRVISGLGWCYFNPVLVSFALSFNDIKRSKYSLKLQQLLYLISSVFFLLYLSIKPAETIEISAYGFIDKTYSTSNIDTMFCIYTIAAFIIGFVIISYGVKNSRKNRVRKQFKIILTTGIISFIFSILSDFILPMLGIDIFPFAIVLCTIGMGGMWYAINKHKLMSISSEFVLEYIFEGVDEPIFILSEDFLVKNCNQTSLNLTGYNYEDILGNLVDTIINFRDFKFNTIMQTGKANILEVDLYKKNKEEIVCELSSKVIYDEYNDIVGIVILLHDITERKKLAEIQKEYTLKLEESNCKLRNQIKERLIAEEKIRHFIYYDTLTELANRKKMLEDIELLITNKNEKFAVLFIDLDWFKSINDDYGHEAGDYILKTVSMRLKKITSEIDTVSRIGGDEFVIIQKNLKNTADAEKLAEAVLKEIKTAFTYKTSQLCIGGSIGISIFPDHGDNTDMLINKADLAMYKAKKSGEDEYALYNDNMNSNVNNG